MSRFTRASSLASLALLVTAWSAASALADGDGPGNNGNIKPLADAICVIAETKGQQSEEYNQVWDATEKSDVKLKLKLFPELYTVLSSIYEKNNTFISIDLADENTPGAVNHGDRRILQTSGYDFVTLRYKVGGKKDQMVKIVCN